LHRHRLSIEVKWESKKDQTVPDNRGAGKIKLIYLSDMPTRSYTDIYWRYKLRHLLCQRRWLFVYCLLSLSLARLSYLHHIPPWAGHRAHRKSHRSLCETLCFLYDYVVKTVLDCPLPIE
jgi:hypothetical protein